MCRKGTVLLLALLMTCVFTMGSIVVVDAEEENMAWVLVETKRLPIPEVLDVNLARDSDDFWKYYGFFDGDTIDIQTTGLGTLGGYGSTDYSKPTDLHARYTWSMPPSVLQANQMVTIRVTQEVINNYRGNYGITLAPYVKVDASDMPLGFGTSSSYSFGGVYPDGTETVYHKISLGASGDEQFQTSTWVDFKAGFKGAGTVGKQYSIYIAVTNGGGALGSEYVYEWKENTTKGEAFDSGVRLKWGMTSDLGYRLYRSTDPSSLGISVTDFYITSVSYADVNVLPSTTYYYTVKPILAEADPFNGVEEKLGATIATYVLTTKAEIYKQGSYKNFILLQLDNPMLTKNGVDEEIDPGRGTMPIIMTGRTMIPIRSVVEAIGGTVEWEGTARKITLNARGNKVEMWVGKTDLMINGVKGVMDVAPTVKNGRTFVPVRFAAENLNCKVDWINSTKEVVIVYEE